MADIFMRKDVREVLYNKKVVFLGDSILRNIYQDFVWLFEHGEFTPHQLLRKKGEQLGRSEFPDELLAGTGQKTPGRHYKEVREFSGTDRSKSYKFNASFFFITKCHSIQLEDYLLTYKRRHGHPDLILILSALWDINRWGPNGIPNYINNCERFLKFVKDEFRSKTQLIWLTCPPISVEVWGGLVVEGMEFQKRSMRFNVMEANLMVATKTASHGFDVVDLHYWMLHQIHKRMPDGIHWTQDAVRHQVLIILTHFCLSRDIKLPGHSQRTLDRNKPLESVIKIAKAVDVEQSETKDRRREVQSNRSEVGPSAKKRKLYRDEFEDISEDENYF